MLNRIIFNGGLSLFFENSVIDVNKREYSILFILVSLTILLGIYPSLILDGLHISTSTLIYGAGGSC
jgi:NADH-ubiquinone oxidoreductase chain 4